jgi:hypothetical protein
MVAVNSVQTNRVSIVLSVASLILLIDEKLASLRDARRNDPDAQEEIEHYESIKQNLEALRNAVDHDTTKDEAVESAANKFVQRVRGWWERRHEKICDTAYEAAIFLTCVSVCSLVGSGGPFAVAISGAIAGRKTVVDALKAIRGTSSGARR